MYVIETDLGRFEAETEKQAKGLLRKAEKARKEQEMIDRANCDMAYLKAKANGFKLLTEFMEGKPCNHVWIVEEGDSLFGRFVRVDEDDPRKSYVRMDDCEGVISLYAYRCIAIRLKSSGEAMMIWTQDMDHPSVVAPLAVGCHGNRCATEYLPDGLTLSWVKQETISA